MRRVGGYILAGEIGRDFESNVSGFMNAFCSETGEKSWAGVV